MSEEIKQWADDNPIEIVSKGHINPKYDIVIHCASQEEHDKVEKALECFFSVDAVKNWISEIEDLKGNRCDNVFRIGQFDAIALSWDNAIEEALKILRLHVKEVEELKEETNEWKNI